MVVTRGNGTRTAQPGTIAEMHIKFSIGDTVMINSYEMNNQQPVTQLIQAPSMKGDLMEGITTMKAGDSMVFRMLMDTLAERAHQPKPAWAKPGDYAVWEIKMVSVKTKEEADAENAKKEGEQMAIDDKLLQEYFKTKNIKNLKKTPSGIYYTITKPGTGASPKRRTTGNGKFYGGKSQGFNSNEGSLLWPRRAIQLCPGQTQCHCRMGRSCGYDEKRNQSKVLYSFKTSLWR